MRSPDPARRAAHAGAAEGRSGDKLGAATPEPRSGRWGWGRGPRPGGWGGAWSPREYARNWGRALGSRAHRGSPGGAERGGVGRGSNLRALLARSCPSRPFRADPSPAFRGHVAGMAWPRPVTPSPHPDLCPRGAGPGLGSVWTQSTRGRPWPLPPACPSARLSLAHVPPGLSRGWGDKRVPTGRRGRWSLGGQAPCFLKVRTVAFRRR